MSIQVKFTLRERDLLLDLISIEPDISKKLKLATIKKDTISIKISIEDLDVLQCAIAADANHTKSKKLERELDELYWRVDHYLR